MTGVLYTRYSSDAQREESIEGQIRECTEFAKRNGITILNCYTDRALYEPTRYAAEDIMYTLFELDEHYGNLTLYDVEDTSDRFDIQKHKAVSFNVHLLDGFMAEWQQRKKDLADGVISKAEYTEWKLNWPDTADDLGKFVPKKQWRNEGSD